MCRWRGIVLTVSQVVRLSAEMAMSRFGGMDAKSGCISRDGQAEKTQAREISGKTESYDAGLIFLFFSLSLSLSLTHSLFFLLLQRFPAAIVLSALTLKLDTQLQSYWG
ncbi:hypothetical protein LY76DRAFT_365949 [Colletotrichum caudatum]|nr:hypothetical protein LY76DRAFT_365949 [Colletotrichum caudatum]